MKPLNLSTTIRVGLLLFGILLLISCLKEGVRVNDLDAIQLVVVPSAQEAEVGDTVHFDVLLLGEIVDAALYIDSSNISGHQHVFQEPGIYTIHAEKEGIKNSDSIEIQVGESRRKLKLEASETQITVGDSVSFTALVLGDTIAAEIYINTIKLSDNIYVFDETGTFKAYAVKDGYTDSDTIEITVHSKEQLILFASSLEIKVGDRDTFHVVVNGNPVTDADIYVEDTKVEDSTYFFDEVGTYNVYALKNGFANSDTLKITVTEVQLSKLSLSIPKKEVEAGEYVRLSPMYFRDGVGKQMRDAKVYVDDELVQIAMEGGFPFIWKSDVTGTFEAYATMEGYENSDTLQIVVEDTRPQFIVIPSETEVTAGTNVTFSIKMMMNGKEQPAVDAQIYIDDNVISGYQYTFETPGSYEVVAKGFGGGILDSDPVTITVTKESVSVYVAGSAISTTTGKISGIYWNHHAGGVGTYGLAQGQAGDANKANDIAVDNGDIYIPGAIADYGRNHFSAQYWKRGSSGLTVTTLIEGSAEATAVAIDNGNIYMAGVNGGHPVYWKNGTLIDLFGGDPNDYFTSNDITTYNGDAYIAGGTMVDDAPSDAQAFYWKDNAAGKVALSGDGTGAVATGIAVYNGIVYVSGTNISETGRQAIYWINGDMVKLTSGAEDFSIAYDIEVVNGVVYACGYVQEKGNNYAVYWENGNMVKLTGGTEMAEGLAIAVSPGGDVYVAGWETHGGGYGSVAKYWKVDGTGQIDEVQLLKPTTASKANSIYLDIH